MADYYPLLARALEALPDRTPAMRKAVYDRARNALIGQLRSLEPPLSEADIELERKALDSAIARLETDYGGAPAPANDPVLPVVVAAEAKRAPMPEPRPEPRPEPLQEPLPAPAADAPLPEPAPPAPAEDLANKTVLPPATPPSFSPAEPAPPREASIAIAPRKGKTQPVAAEPAPEAPAETAPSDEAAAAETSNGRQRPRIDVVAPKGNSRLLRNVFVGIVLTLVIGLIAVAAFLLRDKPADLQPSTADTEAPQQSEPAESKFADRIGGESAPSEKPATQPSGPAAERRPQAPPPANPDLAVAQRAILLEENGTSPDSQPTVTNGRVTWRLESVSGEQGQQLETAVVVTITVPEAGLTALLTIQRNLDATLPASHTVSIAFTQTGTESEKRTVQDVGLLQVKDEEAARGSPLSGLPVRVRDNLALIGLSSLRNDIDRNTDLLLHRNWFDLAIRYTSNQRAVLTFEKGSSGTQVLQRAFDQWR